MKRINRKYFNLIILLILISNLYLLSFLSPTYLTIDDDSYISDQIITEPETLRSSSTIESTRITEETQQTNDFIVNMPSVSPDGDLYIAQIAIDDYTALSTIPSGWTEIENGFQSGLGPIRVATYWKIGNSEPATYTWSTSSSVLWIGAIHRISGFDASNPILASKVSIGMNAFPIAPSVNTTIDNCLILRMFGADGDWTVPIYWPSGTNPIFQTDLGLNSIISAAAYHNQSLAGSTGTAQFTMGRGDKWVAITIAIKPEAEEIPPTFSNLIESADPLELGETETISINTSDPSGINHVLIEYESLNHSMNHVIGDLWQSDSWEPNSIGSKSYTIWMEDNNNNLNSTSGSILVIDTTAPTYSDLVESADPLPLGQNETISIKVFDSPGSGVNQVIIEYDSLNHTMKSLGANIWSWSNWKPSSENTFTYKVYMQDNQNNWNVTDSLNITVITTTAPIIENITKSADPLELGNNISITVDVFDNETSVSIVLIEIGGENYTMSYVGGNTFEYNWTRSTVGLVIFTIYANDTGNSWGKLTNSFEIIDTTSPIYANLTESSNLLELGETLIVTIDAFDLSGIKQIRIEFEGYNHSMSNIGGSTWQYDIWTPPSTGIPFYTIWIEDNNNNWNFTISNITVQDTTCPIYSDLIVSGGPIELGNQLIITITIFDLADIKMVLLEYEGSNHSMSNMGGNLWQYDSWMPNRAGNYSYTIYMEDNNYNHNSTNGSIQFQDTTCPIYSDLIESSDLLELGNTEIITIEIFDLGGINKSLIEFEALNYSMTNIYGNIWQYNSWTPSFWTVYHYEIYMEDFNGNSNVTNGNITVQDTTPPSQPIITNSPSGNVSGVLTFDWIDGFDPSGISFYVLLIDNESNPYISPGYILMSNITNLGPESSYFELHEVIPPGSYYFFLMQIDGVGHNSSFTVGTFTIISNGNGNNDIMPFVIIGIIFVSLIASITTIVIVKRKIQTGSLPRRKKIPLKIILSHIDKILDSSQSSEKIAIQKIKKQKENNTFLPQKESIEDKELITRINKIKIVGKNLFDEGAYLEAIKQFEFAEKILLKLGKKQEASLFSDLTLRIIELSEERDKKLDTLEGVKLGNNSLKIFENYYDLIDLSKKLKDFDSASMYLSELTQFYQTDQIMLRGLKSQRLNLCIQANSLIEEKYFEKSAGIFELCEKISQFLVQIDKENGKDKTEIFRENIKECLNKASKK
ncbi:MAG: hypothetical protein KGD67_08420 [Candidatus Lokiarchaeota archaeon]|nr:hypothetical protein [Candidatus Lokiarchaeota archaeon]